eukprot:1161886-Pelagomonas_calceolata.AAC.5
MEHSSWARVRGMCSTPRFAASTVAPPQDTLGGMRLQLVPRQLGNLWHLNASFPWYAVPSAAWPNWANRGAWASI